MKTQNGILGTCLFLGILGVTAAMGTNAGVDVTVYGEHRDGKVLYHYAVTNRTDKPLTRFTLGVGHSDAQYLQRSGMHSYPQLRTAPSGSEEGTKEKGHCGDLGCALILSPDGVSQPAGWKPRLHSQDEMAWYSRLGGFR